MNAEHTGVLDHDAALSLDGQIQQLAGQAAEHLDYLADLLVEAQAGEIHLALGFPSWTAYLADRLKPIIKALDSDDRRALVMQLYESGMSVRAVAETVGTSKSAVARQVSQAGTGDHSATRTTGRDGKTYTRTVAGKEEAVGGQQNPPRRGGGGHRGPLTADMKLKRVKASVGNIVLEGHAAELQTEICRLIDELLSTLQPAEG